MSVFLVIYLLDNLIRKYEINETDQQQLYQSKHYLDKALSPIYNMQINEKFNQEKVIQSIQEIDERFFEIFKDESINIKAFIYKLIDKKYNN